jgi:hypothetical protein
MASGVVLHCGNPPIATHRTPQDRKSSTRSCLNFADFAADKAKSMGASSKPPGTTSAITA